MLWARISAVYCCLIFLVTGCADDNPTTQTAPVSELPTHAQPRLETRKLYVGPTELTAEIAIRPREIMTGMMFRTNVTDSDAMLFVLPSPRQAAFWMMNCPTPLSCAYINPDGIIEEIHDMEPFNTNSIVAGSPDILFVIETAQGWFDRNHVTTGMLVQTESGSLTGTFFRARTQ